jgi:hypothetical protein
LTDIEPLPDWADNTPAIRPPRIDLKRWAEEFRDVYRIAEALCKTPFVPREMIGRQADVAAAIMKGQELGLDPFDALGSIYIVHGRVGFYADFMRRRIVQAGHTLTIVESTETRCVIEGVRKDTGQKHRAQFTADQARRAGIDLGKYPADKLIARATSRLCTQAFPDVLSGTLIAEDLIDGVIPPDTADQPATAEPERPAVQRKRATKPAKAARTQPKPAPTPVKPADDDDELAELLGDDESIRRQFAVAAARTQLLGDTPLSQPPPADQNPEIGTDPGKRRDHDPTIFTASPDLSGPAAATPDPPITKPQNSKLHALMRQLGITTQPDRHTIRDHILGFHVEGELTKNEANTLLDTIDAWQQDETYPIVDRINDILNTAALRAEAEQQQEDSDGL